MLAVYTIVKPAAEKGWLATETLVLGAVSVVLLAGFVVRQRYARSPLMPLALFRSRNLVGANLIQLIGAAGMFGAFFLGTLYLQNLRHYDALQIGLAFLPVTICMGTLSVLLLRAAHHPFRRSHLGARPAWCSWPSPWPCWRWRRHTRTT